MRSIARLKQELADPSSMHRRRIVGEVSLLQGDVLVQDETGSIQVEPRSSPGVNAGDAVEIAGFVLVRGSTPALTEALVRARANARPIVPAKLDLIETLPFPQSGTLVTIEADLLAQRTAGLNQILELHERQRVLTASISTNEAVIPAIASGSRLRITGGYDTEMRAPSRKRTPRNAFLWLRSTSGCGSRQMCRF